MVTYYKSAIILKYEGHIKTYYMLNTVYNFSTIFTYWVYFYSDFLMRKQVQVKLQ